MPAPRSARRRSTIGSNPLDVLTTAAPAAPASEPVAPPQVPPQGTPQVPAKTAQPKPKKNATVSQSQPKALRGKSGKAPMQGKTVSEAVPPPSPGVARREVELPPVPQTPVPQAKSKARPATKAPSRKSAGLAAARGSKASTVLVVVPASSVEPAATVALASAASSREARKPCRLKTALGVACGIGLLCLILL